MFVGSKYQKGTAELPLAGHGVGEGGGFAAVR